MIKSNDNMHAIFIILVVFIIITAIVAVVVLLKPKNDVPTEPLHEVPAQPDTMVTLGDKYEWRLIDSSEPPIAVAPTHMNGEWEQNIRGQNPTNPFVRNGCLTVQDGVITFDAEDDGFLVGNSVVVNGDGVLTITNTFGVFLQLVLATTVRDSNGADVMLYEFARPLSLGVVSLQVLGGRGYKCITPPI